MCVRMLLAFPAWVAQLRKQQLEPRPEFWAGLVLVLVRGISPQRMALPERKAAAVLVQEHVAPVSEALAVWRAGALLFAREARAEVQWVLRARVEGLARIFAA